MEARLTELEIRLTHQEAALDALEQAILRQQRTLDRLAAQVAAVQTRLGALPTSGPDAGLEPPLDGR